MHATVRISVVTLLLSAVAVLVACERAPQQGGAPADKPPAPQSDGIVAGKQVPSIWYTAKLNDGVAERDFWWCKNTDKDGRNYTLIAGALDSLPSSSPGKGGIEAPPRNAQSPNPILIDFCKAEGEQKKETHTLRNGFLYVTVESAKAKSAATAGIVALEHMLLPWPIIIRTPARPAGTFAGTFVLLAIQEPKDTFLRESIFRPNQGTDVDCKDWARPDGDDPDRVIKTFANFCGKEHEFDLNEVSGVHDIKGTIHLQKIGDKDPEALFLVDVCKFARLAREVIAATSDKPGDPLDLPCTSDPN